jgi:hypothetical protein
MWHGSIFEFDVGLLTARRLRCIEGILQGLRRCYIECACVRRMLKHSRSPRRFRV